MSRRLFTIGALALAIVIIFVYFPSLWTGFFAQDYDFLNPLIQLDLPQYLVYVLDPRVQILWYRPLQGIQFLIEFWLFGSNPVPYHWVNIAFHVINCWLLFALVWRVSQKWRIGFLTALLYATFPVYALAVNWINITDPLMTIFYLLGVWFWLNYLQRGERRDYIIVVVAFILALLNKQMAITLPVILFLIDRFLVGKPTNIPELVRRYIVLAICAVLYVIMQYAISTTHVYVGVFGYQLGTQILSIIIQYSALLAFPWGYYPPTDTQITEGFPFAETWNLVWLAIAIVIYLFVTVRRRSRVLLFLGSAMFITLLPVLPFPFVELRYLYLPIMASGVIFALWIDQAFSVLKQPRWFAVAATLALALVVSGSAFSVANANAGLGEVARQRRVPFRDITRQRPTFREGTYLYFIDPVTPQPELTGMFLMRYGRAVTVGSDRTPQLTRLRNYKEAFIYWFDETGKPYEVRYEPNPGLRASLPFPILFEEPIVLDDVEIVRSAVKRGDVLIALLYWNALEKIDRNYTVFVHLVDENGQIVAGYDSQPRKGIYPTRKWLRHVPFSDPIVMPIPLETPLGNDYRLELGLYYFPTMERLSIVDAYGQPITDTFVIQPLSVVE